MPEEHEVVGAVRRGREVRLVVSTVSWEPRFMAGFPRLVERQQPTHVQLLQYIEWKEWTAAALMSAVKACEGHGIVPEVLELSLDDPLSSWQKFRSAIERADWCGASALVDITTMPREALWTVFRFLERAEAKVSYAYHEP